MVLGRVETIDELKRGKAALTKVSCNAWATRQRPLRHSWRREEDSDPYLSGLIPQRMQPDDDSFPKRIFNGTNSSLYKGISTRSINTRRLPIFIKTRNDRNCRIIGVLSKIARSIAILVRNGNCSAIPLPLLVRASRSVYHPPPPSPSPRSIPLLFSRHAAASATTFSPSLPKWATA